MNITEMRKRATAVANTKKAIHEKTAAIKAKQQETKDLIAARDDLTEDLEEVLGDMKKVSHADILSVLDHLARLSDKARALASWVDSKPDLRGHLSRSVLDELIWETTTAVAELDHLDAPCKPQPKKAATKELPPFQGASSDHLADFQEGQWWVKELDAEALIVHDGDFKRAVAVVHNLLRVVKAHTESEPWLAWFGSTGNHPLKDSDLVQYRTRGGLIGTEIAGSLAWRHTGHNDDIIAYRIAPDTHLSTGEAP